MKFNLKPDRRVLRQFAWASLLLLPLLALFLYWKYGLPTGWVATLCSLGVLIAVIELMLVEYAGMLGVKLQGWITRPLFVGLTVLSFPIGFVLSHVLMTVLYYLVITPIALVFRLTGRDVLGRKLEPAKQSYWHDRGAARNPASYFKLY